MKQRILAAMLPVSAFALCFGTAAQAQTPQRLPVDRPSQIDGIKAACTGIGDREENEARWSSYPVKIETVGNYGQWLGDQDVTVQGRGRNIAVHCAGPWLLMGLQPGRYEATVAVPDSAPRHVNFSVPREGQSDVVVRFTDRASGREQANGT